jgi:hypothetical protein
VSRICFASIVDGAGSGVPRARDPSCDGSTTRIPPDVPLTARGTVAMKIITAIDIPTAAFATI